MSKGKILNISMALIGLILTGMLVVGVYKFYRTLHELAKNNPVLMPPRDTLNLSHTSDSLLDINAGLNQQIAEKLVQKKDETKTKKQMLLHEAITDFVLLLDSLKEAGISSADRILRLKNGVNKTNLACRAALFEVRDADQIEELNSFIIVNENKLENTIFECFSSKENETQCFDKIKHQALYIESIILEKNFKQLKT